jgi:dynein heavy chain
VVLLQVCRGLFDAHKLVFSLLIAIAIQRDAGLIKSAEWDFFLRGSRSRSSSSDPSTTGCSSRQAQVDNPAPEWLPERTWQGLRALAAAVPVFAGMPTAISANPEQWQSLLLGSQEQMKGSMGGGACNAAGSKEADMAVGWSKAAVDRMAQLWGSPTPLTAFQRLLLIKVS